MQKFIKDNIERINSGIRSIKEFDEIDIKKFLLDSFSNLTTNDKEKLWREFEESDFVKAKIPYISNKYILYHKDVESFLDEKKLEIIKQDLETSGTSYSEASGVMAKALLEKIGHYGDKKFETLKKRLSSSITSQFPLIMSDGFPSNINHIDSGVMTSNAGDSAQFQFISRAILAGFDSSNVDVRTSRYDAIVGYKGKTFRIQVKGISGSTISFKDRDRGGRGIDTKHERNKGKRITKKDCDIYVAVNKKNGLVYLIPIEIIEKMPKDTVSTSSLTSYLEYWDIFHDLYLKDTYLKHNPRKWKSKQR